MVPARINHSTYYVSGVSRRVDGNQLREAGLLAVHQGDLAVLDEEGDMKDVLHRVGEARRITDKLVEVEGLLVVPLELAG